MPPSVTRDTYPIREFQRQRAQENGVLFRAVFRHDGFVQPRRRNSLPERRDPHRDSHTGKIWKKTRQLIRASLFVCSQRHRVVLPRYSNCFSSPLRPLARRYTCEANPDTMSQAGNCTPSAKKIQAFLICNFKKGVGLKFSQIPGSNRMSHAETFSSQLFVSTHHSLRDLPSLHLARSGSHLFLFFV